MHFKMHLTLNNNWAVSLFPFLFSRLCIYANVSSQTKSCIQSKQYFLKILLDLKHMTKILYFVNYLPLAFSLSVYMISIYIKND